MKTTFLSITGIHKANTDEAKRQVGLVCGVSDWTEEPYSGKMIVSLLGVVSKEWESGEAAFKAIVDALSTPCKSVSMSIADDQVIETFEVDRSGDA